MPSIFANGEKLMQAAFGFASVEVEYRRNGQPLVRSLRAKLGRALFRTDTPGGLIIRAEQRDFIVLFSELGVEPLIGDEIIHDGRMYFVTAPNDEPCWRWHSRLTHSEIRIHTKEAGTFSAETEEI